MTHRDLLSADQAIYESTLPASIKAEMSRIVGATFDGGPTTIDAWAEPATAVARWGSRRSIDSFWDLVGSIDLVAIRAEGEADRARIDETTPCEGCAGVIGTDATLDAESGCHYCQACAEIVLADRRVA